MNIIQLFIKIYDAFISFGKQVETMLFEPVLTGQFGQFGGLFELFDMITDTMSILFNNPTLLEIISIFLPILIPLLIVKDAIL